MCLHLNPYSSTLAILILVFAHERFSFGVITIIVNKQHVRAYYNGGKTLTVSVKPSMCQLRHEQSDLKSCRKRLCAT